MKTFKEICIYMTIALPIYYAIPKDDPVTLWILTVINIISSTVVSRMIYKKLES